MTWTELTLLSTFLFLLFQTWLDYSPAIPFGEHPVLNTYSLHWKHCNNTKKFISVYYWNIGWVFLNFLYQKYVKQYNCHIVKVTAFLIIRWGNIKSRGWKTPNNRHLEAVIVRISILLCMRKKSLCLTTFSTKPTNYLSVHLVKNYNIYLLYCSYTTSNMDVLVLITCVHIAYLHQFNFCHWNSSQIFLFRTREIRNMKRIKYVCVI